MAYQDLNIVPFQWYGPSVSFCKSTEICKVSMDEQYHPCKSISAHTG